MDEDVSARRGKNDMRLHRIAATVWRLSSPGSRKRMVVLFFGMLFLAGVELGVLAGIQTYMGLVSTDAGANSGVFADMFRDMEPVPRLVFLSSALVGLLLLKLVTAIGAYWFLARVVTLQRIEMSTRLFRAYQYAPYLWHLGRNTSSLQRNLTVDTSQVAMGITLPLLQLLLHLVMSLSVLSFIVITLPPVLLGVVAVIGVLLFLTASAAGRVLQAAGRRARRASGDLLQSAQEGLGALTEARLMGRREGFIDGFSRVTRQLASATRRKVFVTQVVPVLLETLMMMSLVLIIGFIVLTADNMQTAFAQATVLAIAIFRLRQSVNKVATAANKISSASAALPPLVKDFETLETDEARAEAALAPPVAPDTTFGALVFDAVEFVFPGTAATALNNITTDIRRGEHLAIMGQTGAGKSTFLAMLLGLIAPTRGALLLDGAPLADNRRVWNAQIGYVPQHVFLVDDTIEANVALGLSPKQRDPRRVRDALERAQLLDFVDALPDGVRSRVGERGGNLSGGQRQRLGIARALYHEPTVVVLDEATSALDRETQAKVMKAIAALPQNPTVISVTHHLDTLTYTDRVILLDKGRVAVDGPVAEVMKNAHFRRVTQAGDFEGVA
jgi:ABC-type multidrug transport system fused ATPase/permease subunit